MPFVTVYLKIFHWTHHPVLPESNLYFIFRSIFNCTVKKCIIVIALNCSTAPRNGTNTSTLRMGRILVQIFPLTNRGGRTIAYAIRESWLSMNIVPFRTVSEWTSTLAPIYARSGRICPLEGEGTRSCALVASLTNSYFGYS